MLDHKSDDIIKKTNAARSHNRKVELKLAKQFYDTKGLEGKWKYQLYELQREQDSIQKECEQLNFLSIRSSRDFSRKYGAIHHAEPNLRHRRLDDHRKHCPVLAAKKLEPGKDFFGYHSAPGSHKAEDKSITELEKELDEYFRKPEHLLRKQKVTKRLKHQQEQNEHVQERVDDWKTKISSRRSFSINEPPNLRHLAFLRDELIDKNSDAADTKPSKEKNTIAPRPKTVAIFEKRRQADSPGPILLDEDSEELLVEEKLPKKSKESAKEKNEAKPAPLSITAVKDVVDDFDLYAPDGRLRMALRMPDVDDAFKQAAKARYVRTKFKREFERQISNSDIFKQLQ